MNQSMKKIKTIYLPFLIISISVIFIYNLISIGFEKEFTNIILPDIVNYWLLPFILAGLSILIWFRPRIKLLKTKGNVNKTNLYIVLSIIAILLPAYLSREFTSKAFGNITHLDSINLISVFDKTKYYTCNNYYIDTSEICYSKDYDYSGKYGKNFEMYYYFAVPVFKKAEDTNKGICDAWICKRYWERTDNIKDDNIKNKLFEEFRIKSLNDFRNNEIRRFIFLERIDYTERGEQFSSAISKSKKYSNTNIPRLIPKLGKYEKRAEEEFYMFGGSFVIIQILSLIVVLKSNIKNKSEEKYENIKSNNISELINSIRFLLPRKDFLFTPISIYLFILIYLFFVMIGFNAGHISWDLILKYGGNYKPFTVMMDWWRLISYIFIHSSFMQLLVNVFCMYYTGKILEPIVGSNKFGIIFILLGVFSGCSHIYFNEYIIGAGASGAISGLYGILSVIYLMKANKIEAEYPFFYCAMFFLIVNVWASSKIDLASNIGGFSMGLIFGLIISIILKNTNRKEEKI